MLVENDARRSGAIRNDSQGVVAGAVVWESQINAFNCASGGLNLAWLSYAFKAAHRFVKPAVPGGRTLLSATADLIAGNLTADWGMAFRTYEWTISESYGSYLPNWLLLGKRLIALTVLTPLAHKSDCGGSGRNRVAHLASSSRFAVKGKKWGVY
ncbi:hypothetical protein KEM54_005528 [Ascosphaera aggregata]|nr:hypothetical protein KEM54_005528 [Ascosphaera aggregata]